MSLGLKNCFMPSMILVQQQYHNHHYRGAQERVTCLLHGSYDFMSTGALHCTGKWYSPEKDFLPPQNTHAESGIIKRWKADPLEDPHCPTVCKMALYIHHSLFSVFLGSTKCIVATVATEQP